MHLLTVLVGSTLLLAGCGGSKTPSTGPAAEATPAAEETPAPEATSAAAGDDDDSAKAAAAGDDDDSAKAAAAGDDDDSAKATDGVAEGDVPSSEGTPDAGEGAKDAELPEPTSAPEPQKGNAADPGPDPREESNAAPFSVSILGSDRTSVTEGWVNVTARGEADVLKAITWTTSGPKAAGPKQTKGKEDSSFRWTLSGLAKTAQKGSITAKYDKWQLSVEYELPAIEEEPPPADSE